ncbi:MAG: T9SS type A sorting domain-containing protein [Bacteroidetes bacterium]|nr:T9SS type A sorting domain-containing protein [Bacteroidota bacterium]
MKKKIIFSLLIAFTFQLNAQMGFWTLRTAFPTNGRSAATGFCIGSAAYVSCGIDSAGYKRSTYLFNPASNSWTQMQSVGGVPGSGLGRDVTMSFTVGNYAYLVGGQGSIAYFSDTWKYDAFNDVWTQVQTFPAGGRRSGVGFAINSKGYVALGQTATGLQNDLWEYNTVANTWIQKANFPGTARRLAVCFVINSIAYIGTGDDGICKGDFFSYDQSTNAWLPKATLAGTPRYGAVGFTLNGKGYVGFGYDNTLSNKKDFWEYDPTGDSWLPMANFPGSARSNAVAISCPNNKAYMGIGYDSLYRNDWWEFDPLSNGINENHLGDNQVAIFPNPMVESTTINFDAALVNANEKITISIFDMQGKEIQKFEMKNETQIKVDREGMSPGIYLVNVVSSHHGSLTKRLMVE